MLCSYEFKHLERSALGIQAEVSAGMRAESRGVLVPAESKPTRVPHLAPLDSARS